MSTPRDDDWFTCPNCGEAVCHGALACPHCGADEQTGWSQDTAYDDLDLPDEAFGAPARETRQQTRGYALVAVVLVVMILIWVSMGLW